MNQLVGVFAALREPLPGARGRVFRTRLLRLLTDCSGKLRLHRAKFLNFDTSHTANVR